MDALEADAPPIVLVVLNPDLRDPVRMDHVGGEAVGVAAPGRDVGVPLRTLGRAVLLYLDQNYLSGIAKRKPAFRELDPVLRDAVRRGAVQVPESAVHRIESAARPDLGLLELLRELSGGLELGSERGAAERRCENALRTALERDHPDRTPEPGDERDVEALSFALPRGELVTCDAFMADLVHRARLDVWFPCEIFTGRRRDVERLRRRLERAPGNQ